MVVSILILVFSTALFFFYLQGTCQRILRREFDQAYFQTIVRANLLDFPAVRQALSEPRALLDHARLRVALKCDFLALTYLLKNAANVSQRYSLEERLLMAYFHLAFASLIARHWLRVGEKPAILKLTAILQYFANLVGQRVNTIHLATLTATD